MKLPVANVIVAGRHRTDLGNLRALADSILAVGLLHPIVVDEDYRLIAGQRRFEAWKLLHGTSTPIPVHVVDTADTERLRDLAEQEENVCRKDFNPSEAVAMAAALEVSESAAAKNRQGTRTDLLPGKFLEGSQGRTLDKVGARVGLSGKTLDKAKSDRGVSRARVHHRGVPLTRRRMIGHPLVF